MNRIYVLSALILLPLSSCTVAQLTPDGDKVEIVDSISPTDLLTYQRVASLSSSGMESQTDCLNDLRNQASRAGATVLRVMPAQPSYCAYDTFSTNAVKKCFSMQGFAYRPKPSAAPAK